MCVNVCVKCNQCNACLNALVTFHHWMVQNILIDTYTERMRSTVFVTVIKQHVCSVYV